MYMLLSTLIYPRAHPCSCDHFLTPYPLTDTHSHQEEHSNEGQVIDKARTDHSNIYPMFVCVFVSGLRLLGKNKPCFSCRYTSMGERRLLQCCKHLTKPPSRLQTVSDGAVFILSKWLHTILMHVADLAYQRHEIKSFRISATTPPASPPAVALEASNFKRRKKGGGLRRAEQKESAREMWKGAPKSPRTETASTCRKNWHAPPGSRGSSPDNYVQVCWLSRNILAWS